MNDYALPHPCQEGCPEGQVPLCRFTGVPVLENRRVVAVACVANKQAPYTEADTLTLSLLAAGVWDLLKRKKLETQLRHSQKMEAIGTLAGGIAHDFNNIINVIMGYGNMVLERLTADDTAREDMNTVLSAAQRAADLTRRLLVFSRKETAEKQHLNINELILDLQKMLVRIVRENIAVRLALGDLPVTVLADAGLIEQVLMNLVANAKDAMPEGGQLSIGTGLAEMDSEFARANGYGRPGKYALITVSDTGVGMDEEIRKRIFEPFFTTKEVGRGTGLGLAISYGIVKQHDGYIKVYSEPGHGTTFNIYLPFMEGARPDAPAPKRQAAAAARIMDGSETILVAEDDTAVRELTARVLESRGYTVIAARDGVEAMAEFMAHREGIDLLLLDMIMPRKNGKEVAEEIRKAKPLIKVLLASGYTDSIVPAAELTAAGFAFIHKPFQSKELLGKVREVLDGP